MSVFNSRGRSSFLIAILDASFGKRLAKRHHSEPWHFKVGWPLPSIAVLQPQLCTRTHERTFIRHLEMGKNVGSNTRPSVQKLGALSTMPPPTNYALVQVPSDSACEAVLCT